MKTLLAIVLLLTVIFGIWWFFSKKEDHIISTREQPISVHSHSSQFNNSVSTAMNSYFDMKSAFVDADTSRAKEGGRKFLALMDSIKTDELKSDTTAIYQSAMAQVEDIKTNAAAMLKESDITEMRQDFRMISENLYPFLKTIKYEGPNLYWQNCPMAFGENKEANWISNTKEIINPYLGKNHPEYKSAMLHCGEVKDTIK
jgi:hypothetical protein